MGKDTEWKDYFQDNQRYADIINGIGCDGLQFVKDTDLEVDDSAAGKGARDLLRKTAFGANFAIIGIENQDSIDYEFPLRNMGYDVRRYQRQYAKIRKEVRNSGEKLTDGEYMYGFKKDSRLKPQVTFLIYSGKEVWDGPTNLHDILDFSEIPDKLRSMTADYKINVIDIRRMENTDVFQTDVRHVFDFIRCSGDKKKLIELVESDPYYHEMEDDAYEVATKYANAKELMAMKKCKTKGGKNDVCEGIRGLMEDAKMEGIEVTKIENARNLLGLLEDEMIAEKIGLPLDVVKAMHNEVLQEA